MNFQSIKKMDLRRLILALTIASVFISLANTFYASYQVQRQQLIDAALQSNYAYATKLADSTDDFFESAMQQLKYGAKAIAMDFSNKKFLDAEAERLLLQTDSFNSIVIIDSNTEMLATSPNTLNLVGLSVKAPAAIESVKSRRPLISSPYLSMTGNLLIFISHPIFDTAGNYLGVVAGTIYLKQKNILNRLLGSHYYQDGSYLYVVDQERRLIYHPVNSRVGTVVTRNAAIDEIIAGVSGKKLITNSLDDSMLAGYSIVAATGWGVVAQRPQSSTLEALDDLMFSVLKNSLPVAVVLLLIIGWCARRISKPLKQLADGAKTMDKPSTAEEIQGVKSWYFESSELKKAMLLGIGLLQKNIHKLRQDVQTDPLTGLGNRRTLEHFLQTWALDKTPFSVVSIDIDFFKKINDNHGHDVGDEVLKKLAQHMRECAREHDVFCRIGGEEFLILLPNTDKNEAQQVAERLRQQIERADMSPVSNVTISIGIANWPANSTDIATVFKLADEMLYQAKRSGRNRVEVH